MRNQTLPLINEFYADTTRPWSQQDVVNWLPCAAESEGTRTPTMLKTPPGLSPLVSFEDSTPPGRGVYVAENRLFTVVGDTLYQISNTFNPFPLGTVPGVGQARFAHNQIANSGNQLLVVNGTSGYVWNTITSVFEKITDPGYPGAIDAVFLDGFLVQIEPARRFAFNSDPADALAYNTLDRFTSEASPDLLVGLAVSNNELILFSERTAEFFYNSGASQQPFRSKRITMERGCAGRYTIANLDNTVYWLGDDGSFYMLDGYTPRRISNRPIEQAIRGLNWGQAIAEVWEDAGHKVCYWTFPDGFTLGYDASQRKWHRRTSYGLDRWRVNGLARWANRWVAGDFQYGRLWELDWDYILEGDEAIESECTGPVIHDNQNTVLMPRLELIMDTGQPETVPRDFPAGPWPGPAPSITGDAPNGAVGAPYAEYDYVVTGDAPLVVTLREGVLPAGLTFTLGSGAQVDAGTPTTAETQTFTLRVTDTWGRFDELEDTIVIADAEIACSSDGEFDGGEAFPSEVTVALGAGTGNVVLTYATGPVPDKLQVVVGGVVVIDTGYHGDVATYQAPLDAFLIGEGLPTEPITQYPGAYANATLQWDSIVDRESASYYKATADTVATVLVWGPLAGTLWYFNLSCPDGAPPP